MLPSCRRRTGLAVAATIRLTTQYDRVPASASPLAAYLTHSYTVCRESGHTALRAAGLSRCCPRVRRVLMLVPGLVRDFPISQNQEPSQDI